MPGGARRFESPVELVVSKRRLREILCKRRVVIALFTSPTCPACQMFKPIFYAYAAMAKEQAGDDVAFIEVDVEVLLEEALKLGVMATPTILVFESCKPVDGFQGLVDPATLAELLAPYTRAEIPVEDLERIWLDDHYLRFA
ncbi:MAG: thioredoxin family protein [Pyrodictiaceae archaeon]